MSDGESHHHGKNEIIIVKRHKGDHDGAHGGAWKIAYADFMTAMMAFFLIMWLVNAANEETKAAVASYFNPIKLTSEVPPDEGLLDPKKTKQKEQDEQGSKADKEDTKTEDKASEASEEQGKETTTTEVEQVKSSEADYFENPYAVIAEIAQETDDKANISLKGEGGAKDAGPGTGADGGKAFKDPFDPDFWTQQVEVSRTTAANNADNPEETVGLPGDGAIEGADDANSVFTGEADKGDKKSGDQEAGDLKSGDGLTDKDGLTDTESKADKVAADKPTKADSADKDKSGKTDKDKTGKSDKDKNGKSDKDKNGKTDKDKNGTADKDKDGKLSPAEKKLAAAEKQAAQLQAELKKELAGKIGYLAEGLVVTPAEGGMLISISDQIETPMFRLGSSIPTKETVRAMDQIAKLLKTRKGQIAIRGHTDARPYKDKAYDNWRLSTDRAQSAYYMLLHGGLDEKRISQVSGFADHRLKDPKNPMDESNRRIEILLQADAG